MDPFNHTLFFLTRYKKPPYFVPSEELLALKKLVHYRKYQAD